MGTGGEEKKKTTEKNIAKQEEGAFPPAVDFN